MMKRYRWWCPESPKHGDFCPHGRGSTDLHHVDAFLFNTLEAP